MTVLDVRDLACGQRHTLIFTTFERLGAGESFEFVNDHRPTPLYHQFCQRYPDQFSWEYREEGPDVWRMVIRRVAQGTPAHFEPDVSLRILNTTGGVPMKVVDVREIVPRERHPFIFQTFDSLAPDEKFELVNDHDPKPLYYQFMHERPGQFTWEYLEEGPMTWRVSIGRQTTAGNA